MTTSDQVENAYLSFLYLSSIASQYFLILECALHSLKQSKSVSLSPAPRGWHVVERGMPRDPHLKLHTPNQRCRSHQNLKALRHIQNPGSKLTLTPVSSVTGSVFASIVAFFRKQFPVPFVTELLKSTVKKTAEHFKIVSEFMLATFSPKQLCTQSSTEYATITAMSRIVPPPSAARPSL